MAKSPKKKPKSAPKAEGTKPAKSPASTSSDVPKSPKRRSTMVAKEKIAEQRAAEKRRRLISRALIAVAVVAAAALVGYTVYRVQEISDLPNPQGKPPKSYSIPASSNGVDVSRTGITVGNQDAPVRVDLFLDYNCPHCKEFEEIVGKYLDSEVKADHIKLVHHPIAILSPYSVLASGAAGCAQDSGKFSAFQAELFKAQGKEFNDERLTKLGENAGLSSKEFKQCVDDRKYVDWTLGLNQDAFKHEIRGTPTIVVDGVSVSPSLAKVRSQINERLEKAGKQ